MNKTQLQFDEWETPSETYHHLCEIYRVNPQVDVACTTLNCKCSEGYYADQNIDGLTIDWTKTVWCNPPHSETEKWVRKAHEQWQNHNVTVMMTLPANSMSSRYWHDCIEGKAEYHAVKGRLRFLKDGKPTSNLSRNAYVCVIWRQNSTNVSKGDKGGKINVSVKI